MKLIIVIPCYNEELVLRETAKQLAVVLERIQQHKQADECEILFVNDGSKDNTWPIIEELSQQYAFVHGLKLAHNVGHQYALWAGYEWAADKCDAMVSIDADLQHDISTIETMLNKYHEGYEVVYGVRNDRATDGWFKKKTALGFYKLMTMMGVDIIPNHADYRLLSSRAAQALVSYPERNIFIRGMVRTLGFKECEVRFNVLDRFAGESKYTLRKMFNFAIDGITSFSVQPLRLITSLGLLMMVAAVIATIYVLVSYFTDHIVQGWTSILLSIWFIGGLQMMSIGVIGEYIGKIYKETKRRPRYIIEKTV
ncbi:MAG: glycosyltransferase family 2 protein [Paludibacteraceae bacterium]|nr:glycosyltransferase family 2 protein [Paludibacteraceae bacterium]